MKSAEGDNPPRWETVESMELSIYFKLTWPLRRRWTKKLGRWKEQCHVSSLLCFLVSLSLKGPKRSRGVRFENSFEAFKLNDASQDHGPYHLKWTRSAFLFITLFTDQIPVLAEKLAYLSQTWTFNPPTLTPHLPPFKYMAFIQQKTHLTFH